MGFSLINIFASCGRIFFIPKEIYSNSFTKNCNFYIGHALKKEGYNFIIVQVRL